MSTGVEWLLIATNGFFILPSIKSAMLHRYTRAVLYFLMIFASSFHHACIGGINCVLPAEISRKTDFFFAQLLIPVTVLYLIEFSIEYAYLERYLIWGFMVLLYAVEIFSNEPFLVQCIVVGVSLGILLLYWLLFVVNEILEAEKYGPVDDYSKVVRLPDYGDWSELSSGLCLSVLAVGLFGTQARWPGGYDYIHSLWHTLAAFGQYWILCARPEAPATAVMDARIRFGRKIKI